MKTCISFMSFKRGIAHMVAGLATTAMVGVAVAAPPSDRALADASANYERLTAELRGTSLEARQAAADEALGAIEFTEMSLAQIETFMDASELCYYTSRRNTLDDRLVTLGTAPTEAGSRAMIRRLELLTYESTNKREVIESVLDHPALAKALRDGKLWSAFMVFEWYVDPPDVRGLEAKLVRLGAYIPEKPPMLGVLGAVDVFSIVAGAEPSEYERREPLRVAVVEALRRLATYVDPDDPDLQRWNFARDIPGHIRNEIARLEGPAIRGMLMDRPAPELDFIWDSGGGTLTSLAPLRGKVVVLDFWATWCGPCVASFPKTEALVEHYKDSPVAVIGVTSLQGAHIEFGESVDCKDDPKKEFELMADYVKRRGITWTIAFSKQPVYNPSYNIRGIPQIVLIDTQGRVRHRGLHPHTDHARVRTLIDELLIEAGLATPLREEVVFPQDAPSRTP